MFAFGLHYFMVFIHLRVPVLDCAPVRVINNTQISEQTLFLHLYSTLYEMLGVLHTWPHILQVIINL